MQSASGMGASGGSGGGGELFASYSEVQIRRAWEMEVIKAKLARNEPVDINICRLERTSGDSPTVKLGLKRGKLLYVFKYPTHSVERDKHRNVITRARFVKDALENAGYQPIPWDFKKNKPPKFWEDTMEEEDDDLYGPADSTAEQTKKPEPKRESDGESGDEPMDEGLESGEEEDDDDSDSDLEIIIDKPATAPKPVLQQQPQESKAIKIEAPPQPSSTPSQPSKGIVPQLPSQPGTAFPAQRTSDIDINADPTFAPLGKPILQVDIDADLAEHTKPWRLPGADQSDYFNYGFDEFTWEMYRQRQQQMVQTLANQKAETAQMQQFFNAPMPGAMPGAPNPPAAPSGPPSGPAAGAGAGAAAMAGMGVPPGGMNEEQMQMMFQQMAAQGMDPSQMDFGTFMQMAGGFGAPTGPQGGFGGGPQQGAQGSGGGGGGGGRGRGGRGRGW